MTRLTDEQLKACEGHAKAPWRWWTSCSFRRLSSDATGKDGDVLHASKCSDGCLDITIDGGAEGPTGKLIESAPALLAEVLERRAADAKVRELIQKIDKFAEAEAYCESTNGEHGGWSLSVCRREMFKALAALKESQR